MLHELGRADAFRLAERGGVWGVAGARIAIGGLEDAADLLGEKGLHTEEAYDRLRGAEGLAGAARSAQLEPVLAFYRAVGAASYVLRAEALLPASV